LALGVIGLPVTARDRILRCSPSVVGTTRAGPRASIPFIKMKGQRWLIPHLIWGGKRIDISMWYSPFHFRWERTAKSIRTLQWRNKRRAKRQWRAKRMRKGHGEIKKCGGEAAELIPFASWAQSSALFPGQIKDLGLIAKDIWIER